VKWRSKPKSWGTSLEVHFLGECADCHPRMKALVKARRRGGPTWDTALT
jgi:hypothetical protein